MRNIYKELILKIKEIKKTAILEEKKTVFFVGNTKKKENILFYLTPIRHTQNYVYFGIVIFNDNTAKKIAKIVDGKFDLIFVDTEKKTFKKSKLKKNKIVNIERTIKENIKKSYLRFYKANDLTVNAAEDLIESYFKNEIRNISGKKILIFGSGNIGFKLGLRLIERGAGVFLYRRNKNKLKKMCDVINFIKPQGTITRAKPIFKLNKNLNFYDAIIFTANTKSLIKIKSPKTFKKKILLLDIGKGMFGNESLKILNKNNILVYRLDVTPALNTLIEETNTIKQFSNRKFKIKKWGKYTFTSSGLLGAKNSILVDNPTYPKIIFGVCDGRGDFIRLTKIDKKKLLENICKLTKKKINFV